MIVQISSWQNTQRAAVQHLPTVPTTYPNARDQRRRARQPLSLPVTFRSDLGQHAAARVFRSIATWPPRKLFARWSDA